jgi:hypothetical protein
MQAFEVESQLSGAESYDNSGRQDSASAKLPESLSSDPENPRSLVCLH